jgi:hypothetical protein
MSDLLEKLISKSSFVHVILFLVILIIVMSIVNGDAVGVGKLKQMTNGVGIIGMEPGYSVEKAYDILEKQGAQGRDYYLKRILPMDYIFGIAYSTFYFSVLLFLLKQLHNTNPLVNFIALAPILAVIFDYLENFAILRMLVSYPQKLVLTAQISDVFTLSKLGMMFVSWGSILILLIMVIVRLVGSKISA